MQLTDTLSHKIISHKRHEPITSVVSKYRIQMKSNDLLKLWQQNTGLHHYKKSAQNNTQYED